MCRVAQTPLDNQSASLLEVEFNLLASIHPRPSTPQATTKPLLNHVSVNMPHLAVYAHTSLGFAHFLQECVGALPALFSLPTSQLLTQRMWCICSGCVLSVVTPLEFCSSRSFEARGGINGCRCCTEHLETAAEM